MNSEIEKKDETAPMTLTGWFNGADAKSQLSRALGPHVDVEKYIRGILTTIETDTNKLKQCTPGSIIRCVLVSAQLGLSVDARQHAYLIPRRNNELNCLEATFMPGYKGYLFKIRESDMVAAIYIEAVYKDDKFEVIKGTDPKIIHVPSLDNDMKPENITHFYAIAKLTNGEYEFEVMSRAQVDVIKNTAKTQMIWGKHYQEMGRKTVLLRLVKKLQMPETEVMSQIDNNYHNGKIATVNDEGSLLFEDKSPQLLDNKNADIESSPEKEKLIIEIRKQFEALEWNTAFQVKEMNQHLKVAELEIAKEAHLKIFKGILDSRIEKMISGES